MSFSEIDIIDKIATHERSIQGVNYSYLGAQNPGGKPNVPGVLHLSPHFLCRQIAFNNEWKNFAEITSYLLVCPREAYGGKLSKIESLAIPFGERWRNKFQDRNTIAEISRDLPRVLLLELSSAKYRTDIEHDGIAWVGWEFTFNVEYQEIGNMTRSFFYNVTDYGAIGDGAADDTAAIQLAINMAENGGIVAIPPGTYRITSSLTFPLNTDYPSIILAGAGKETTILSFSLASSAPCIPIGLTSIQRNIEICNLTIRGVANAQYGLHFEDMAFCRFENINIDGITDTGVRGETGNNQNVFEQVRVFRPPSFGFINYGVANRYNNCIVQGASPVGSSGIGFAIHEAGAVYNGCIADTCDKGFDVSQYAYSIVLNGIHTEKCQHGIRITAGDVPYPNSTTILGGLVYTSSTSSNGGILINRSNRTTIMGLHVELTSSGSSFQAQSAASNVQLFNCNFLDSASANIDPTAIVTIY